MDEVLDFVLAVKAAHREINLRFSEALRPLGITVVQAEALLLLAESEPLSVRELGSRLLAEAGNPSRLVDRLVAADLVRRDSDQDDRRQVAIALTTRGRDLTLRVREVRQPLLDWGRHALDGQGLNIATGVLRRLLDPAGPTGGPRTG